MRNACKREQVAWSALVAIALALCPSCNRHPGLNAGAARMSIKRPENTFKNPALEKQLIHERCHGDLDGIAKRRILRVLVAPDKLGFYFDGSEIHGAIYEFCRKFERFLNHKLETGNLAILFWKLLRMPAASASRMVLSDSVKRPSSRNYNNKATNVQWIALLTAGEGLHNNHQEFPASASFAQRAREIDLAWPLTRLPGKMRIGESIATAAGESRFLNPRKRRRFLPVAEIHQPSQPEQRDQKAGECIYAVLDAFTLGAFRHYAHHHRNQQRKQHGGFEMREVHFRHLLFPPRRDFISVGDRQQIEQSGGDKKFRTVIVNGACLVGLRISHHHRQNIEEARTKVAYESTGIDEGCQQIPALRREHRAAHHQAADEHQADRREQNNAAPRALQEYVSGARDQPPQRNRRQPRRQRRHRLA
jgi:hypothetical protein